MHQTHPHKSNNPTPPHPSFLSSFTSSLLSLCNAHPDSANSSITSSLTFSPHFASAILPQISAPTFPEMLIQAKRYENEELVRWRSWIERRYARYETEPQVVSRQTPGTPVSPQSARNVSWEEYMTSEIQNICDDMHQMSRDITQQAQLQSLGNRLAQQKRLNQVRVARMVKERRAFLEAEREREQLLQGMVAKLEGLYAEMREMAAMDAKRRAKGSGDDPYLTYYENEEEFNRYLAQMEHFLDANSLGARKTAPGKPSGQQQVRVVRRRKPQNGSAREAVSDESYFTTDDSVMSSARHAPDSSDVDLLMDDRPVPQLRLHETPMQQQPFPHETPISTARTDFSYLTSVGTSSSTRGALILKVTVDIGRGQKGEIFIHENDNLHSLANEFHKEHGLPHKVVPAIVHHITSILEGHDLSVSTEEEHAEESR